jgi:hypothetical protein
VSFRNTRRPKYLELDCTDDILALDLSIQPLDLEISQIACALFAKHQSDEPTLKYVQERLDLIDQECPRYSFAAERVANMSFRGKKVSIICGPIAWSDAFTHSNRCVYAIVDANQSQWMQQNSDVFEPAFTGSHDSVFWVNIPELLRQTKT